jgi:hypothetical protein
MPIVVRVVIFIVLVFTSAEIFADPVVINTGSISFLGNGSGLIQGQFSFAGNGLSLAGGLSEGNTPGCIWCSPGTALNLDSYLSDFRVGTGTVGNDNFARLFLTGRMVLTSGMVILPLPDAGSIVSFTVPFTLNAFLEGCEQSTVPSPCANTLFSTQLAGQGLAAVELYHYYNPVMGDYYNLRGITYNFHDPAAVPEPASILLLLSGLAGAAIRFRRRRS